MPYRIFVLYQAVMFFSVFTGGSHRNIHNTDMVFLHMTDNPVKGAQYIFFVSVPKPVQNLQPDDPASRTG